MQVHHKHYGTLGHESTKDLACLCKWCHAETHGKKELDSKELYRICFQSDRKSVSDGELNQARNRVLDQLGE